MPKIDPIDQRPVHVIAREIAKSWGSKTNYAAVPYLQAMMSLDTVDSEYGADSGRSIIRYFLSNASSWRGETARRIKAELKAMI